MGATGLVLIHSKVITAFLVGLKYCKPAYSNRYVSWKVLWHH